MRNDSFCFLCNLKFKRKETLQMKMGVFPAPQPGEFRTKTVIALIEMNYSRQITRRDMAATVNLSVSRLAHLFTREVGISPERYLMLTRLDRAKRYLETSFLPIKEISALVGMPDVSHFSRAFKSLYGLAPSDYRRRIARKK